jgi:hypothetical protein
LLQEPQGVKSEKTAFFIVTAGKISNLTKLVIALVGTVILGSESSGTYSMLYRPRALVALPEPFPPPTAYEIAPGTIS